MTSSASRFRLSVVVRRILAWSFIVLVLWACVERRAADVDALSHTPGLERDDVEADELLVRLIVATTAERTIPDVPDHWRPFIAATPALSEQGRSLDPHDSRAPPSDAIPAA